MPSPTAWGQYEQILKGSAERILAMAETVATGDIKTRERLANAEITTSKRGQTFAFILALVALAAAATFFAFSNNIAGGIFVSVPVIILIKAFLPTPGG